MTKTFLLAIALASAPVACSPSYIDGGYDLADGGGGRGTGGGGAGGARLCVPSATASCYDGPAGTDGVGSCKAGAHTCAADGMSWGACTGEVLPQPANCASGMDLHCDGQVPSCTGKLLWAKRFGDASDQVATAVAGDPSGNVLATGYFSGSVDFGNGLPLVATAGPNAFVAKLDGSSGGCVWAQGYGTGAALGVAVDSSGNVLVTGHFSGSADFGGGPVTSTGKTDAFVVVLDPNGGYLWSSHFGALGASASGTGIAVDASGNAFVTGYFSGSVDFGTGPIVSTGMRDVFLVELSHSGALTWAKHYGQSEQSPLSQGVTVDPTGSVLVTGYFSGSIAFGGAPLTSTGESDVFVFKLGSDGGYAWSERFGAPGALSDGRSVATDSLGNPIVTGGFSGPVDFGGGPLAASGAGDTFLVKLSAASSGYAWSTHFGDGSAFDSTTAGAVAFDAAGNVLVGGDFTGAVKFGGPPAFSSGEQDVFLAKLRPDGSAVWSETFGDPSSTQAVGGVATDASNNVLVTGYFSGSIDFGGGALTSAGGDDIFVAKLSP